MTPRRRAAAGLIAALAALLLATAARALPAIEPLRTDSPRATFQSFHAEAQRMFDGYVAYRRDKTMARFVSTGASMRKLRGLFDLGEVAPATRAEVGGASIVMLQDILLRLPPIDPQTIPGPEDPPDQWRIPGTAITIARQTEGPREGAFLFSADTVARLPDDHALALSAPLQRPSPYDNWRREHIRFTGPWFSYDLLSRLPAPFQTPVLDTPAWKVALIALLYAAILAATLVWARLVRRRRARATPTAALSWRLTTPLALAGLVAVAQAFAIWQINLSGDFAAMERLVSSAVVFLSLAWAAVLLCFLLVEAVIASPWVPEGSYDAHLLRLLARVGALLSAGAILIFGANDLGIPALGLVAGLGVGGFALALAAQSTVENLFGGVSIFADKPFRVGDFINYGGAAGVVEAIGPRSSRLRGLDGTLPTVPNADLAKMHVINYSMRNKCLFLHTIGLRYETDPDQLDWLMDALRRLLAGHEMVEESPGYPRVRLVAFGASSLDVELRAHVLTSNYSEFLEVQEALMLDVMRLIERAGTGSPFPARPPIWRATAGWTRPRRPSRRARAGACAAGRRRTRRRPRPRKDLTPMRRRAPDASARPGPDA